MSPKFIITGTDTDVGKTVFTTALMLAMNGEMKTEYWKPVQSGIQETVDTRRVQTLSGYPDNYFHPETYVLSQPLSPHRAAELDNVTIDIDALEIPDTQNALLIEGAGGALVPLTRTTLFIDVFALWRLPVVVVARTELGTLNHTLLTLEALNARKIPIHGVAFVGQDNPDNIQTISEFGNIKILGRLPVLEKLNAATLLAVFKDNFKIEDFLPEL